MPEAELPERARCRRRGELGSISRARTALLPRWVLITNATAVTVAAWVGASGSVPSLASPAAVGFEKATSVPGAAGGHGEASGRSEHAGRHSRRCYQEREARLLGRGGHGRAPAFGAAFRALRMTLETSVDEGIDPVTLQVPIAIEKVCGIPRRFARKARRLAGNDGIALVEPETSVFDRGTLVQGAALIGAFEGADTASVRAQLVPRAMWGADEDGNRIPTFSARWIKITD